MSSAARGFHPNTPPGPWPVAATFIGTVVGAGFASGQEILSFFSLFGWPGTLGIGVATLGFAWGGRWWLEAGARTGADSYREALHALAGPWAGGFFEGLLTAALIAGTGIMTAGAAAVAQEQLGCPPWIGRLVFVILCVATVWRGLPGVVAANVVVVPLMVGAVLLVSVYSLAAGGWTRLLPWEAWLPTSTIDGPASSAARVTTTAGGSPGSIRDPGSPWSPPGPPVPPPSTEGAGPPLRPESTRNPAPPATGQAGRTGLLPVHAAPASGGVAQAAAGRWWVAAFLYVGFNLFLSVPVLVPLGAGAPAVARRGGALMGAASLGVLALLLHLALLAHMPAVATREVPVLALTRHLASPVRLALAAVLWTEIYTTAVGGLYGLATRMGSRGSRPYRLTVVATAVAALGIADTGFAQLVRAVYPLKGWLGLLLMVWLLAAGLHPPRRPA